MAASSDPKVLMAAAKCFSCLTPHQQQQVSTYLLAVIAGQDTSAAGVRAMMAAAKCFECLTTKELLEVQDYLLASLTST